MTDVQAGLNNCFRVEVYERVFWDGEWLAPTWRLVEEFALTEYPAAVECFEQELGCGPVRMVVATEAVTRSSL